MSIAGGYYKAVEAASEVGCDCVQLFTKNNNQWACKPILDSEVELFRNSLKTLKIKRPLSHASYLINVASGKDDLWQKSVDSLVVEWQRAEQLGLDGVVFHPGSFVDSTEQEGLSRVAKAIEHVAKIVKPTDCWLLIENTAGQGSCLGWNFAQLGWLIERSGADMKVGVCIDTCHTHAAGYDLAVPSELKRMVADIDENNLADSIRAIHLNDSKREAGSRVDRHEHIGVGTIGLEGFRKFLKHPRFKKLPMYLETEKGESPDGRDWDVVNLEILRGLVC
jgi:deoxyribonuclease IV